MTAAEVISELALLGRDSCKHVILKHGIKEPCFGVKIAEQKKIQKTAEKIGRVSVDMGDTSCGEPFAPDHIRKIEQRGGIGKKRQPAKC